MSQPLNSQPLTLRAYIEGYQAIRKAKSSGNIAIPANIKSQKTIVATLTNQIHEKFTELKGFLCSKDYQKMQNKLINLLYDLEGVVNEVMTKLKTSEGISTSQLPQLNQRSQLKLTRKTSINKIIRNQKKTQRFHEQPQFLLEPQQITRQIRFSTDLTNLCASTRTQDLSHNKNVLDKLNSIDEPSELKAQNYFKTKIRAMDSINPQKVEKVLKGVSGQMAEYAVRVNHNYK